MALHLQSAHVSDTESGVTRQLTIKRRFRSPNLISPLRSILRLPNSPHTIKLPMMQIESRITWAGKRIVSKASDDEVTSSMKNGLRGVTSSPAIGGLFQTVHVCAFEEEFDIAFLGLTAPEKVDVTG